MSSAALPEISRTELPRRNPALRILYYTLCLLLVILMSGLWWLYWIARSALPQLDGSVKVPGISSKVRVVRDQQGVPTIEAATLEDLFFAQGYVTAQDRLWQMDMMRRAAAGELSEVIGEATVKMDREQRILGLRLAAQAAEKGISARDRAYFEAYARGVNAFLESHRDRLSLEFRLLKYTPRPWTVTDSMLVGARMVELQQSRWPDDHGTGGKRPPTGEVCFRQLPERERRRAERLSADDLRGRDAPPKPSAWVLCCTLATSSTKLSGIPKTGRGHVRPQACGISSAIRTARRS